MVAAFDAGWSETRAAGGRMGAKAKARSVWADLIRRSGWSPEDALGRWRRFLALQDPDYLPAVERLVKFDKGYLTDDHLAGLEARVRRGSGRRRVDAADYVNTGPRTNPDAQRNRDYFRRKREEQERRRKA